MSYMRGNWYVWGDGRCTHVWVYRPEEDVTTWVKDCEYVAGVAIPDGLFDELAVMRVAELEREGKREAAEKRAVRKWLGNGGCFALALKVRHWTVEQYHTASERRTQRYFRKHPLTDPVALGEVVRG